MDKKNLDKLDRLSRIEYFLRNKELNDSNNISASIRFLIYFFIVTIFLMITSVYTTLVKGISVDLLKPLMDKSWIIYLGLGLAVVMDVVFFIINYIKQRNLDKEFFSVEIKPKEVKNVKRERS
jgi:hypothetical protein